MKATSTKKILPTKAAVKENSFPVVAIGASAGGLEAMMEFLKIFHLIQAWLLFMYSILALTTKAC